MAVWLKYADDKGAINETDKQALGVWTSLMARQYTTRTVRTFERLVEKIRIFDHGLDDFAIEIFKLVVRMREGIDLACPMLFDSVTRTFFARPILVLKVPAGNRAVKKRYPLRAALADIQPFLESLAAADPPPIEEWA